MNPLWATRGFSWGFRFLEKGSFEDPLPAYEEAFADMDLSDEGFQRSSVGTTGPDVIVVRMLDPEVRKDHAGRVIPHDFILADGSVPGLDISTINSVDDFRHLAWPHFESRYKAMWDAPRPDVY